MDMISNYKDSVEQRSKTDHFTVVKEEQSCSMYVDPRCHMPHATPKSLVRIGLPLRALPQSAYVHGIRIVLKIIFRRDENKIPFKRMCSFM